MYVNDAQDQWLSSVRIGNIAAVSSLRDEISKMNACAPVLLQKVLHNGTHAGDELGLDKVKALQGELDLLVRGSSELQRFRDGLLALCDLALRHQRPIVF